MMKKFYLLFFALFLAASAFAQRPLITKWNAADGNIKIPTVGSYTYTYQKVDDASVTGAGTGVSGATLITFPSGGTYIVEIMPPSTFKFNFSTTSVSFNDRDEFLEISQWGDVQWNSSLERMFYFCRNFNITASDAPDLSNVLNMSAMFEDNHSLNANLNHWNTSSVVEMTNMFVNATIFNGDIGNWNTSKVTAFNGMFINAKEFNKDLSSWDTSSAETLEQMFRGASKFNGNISTWNTGNVKSFFLTFQDATNFNQDISSWDTSQVTSMYGAFLRASSFNQNIGSWILNSSAVNMQSMLDNSGMDCENYSRTLKGWAQNPATPLFIPLGAAGRTYGTEAQQYRTILESNKGWTINGDAYDAGCTVSLSTGEIKSPSGRLNVYPVPTTGVFFLESAAAGRARLYNGAGQEVRSFQVIKGKNTLNISSLPAGMYVITAEGQSARLLKH